MDDFLARLNTGEIYPKDAHTIDLWEKYNAESTRIVWDVFNDQYITKNTHNPILRLSQIGRQPALEIAARKFGVIKEGNDHTVSEEHRLLFWTGGVFESWVYFTLQRLGYTVLSMQTDVMYSGIEGHVDFVVRDHFGNDFVLEVKTANDNYFNQCVSKGVDDSRGYLTQLGAYAAALQMPAYWLMVNKNTSQLHVEKLDEKKASTRLKRVDQIIDGLSKMSCFEDAYLYFRPQPPSIEYYQKKPAIDNNGNPLLYVPFNVAHPKLHYLTEQRKTRYNQVRTYVIDYNYPDQYSHKKPCIYQSTLDYWGISL